MILTYRYRVKSMQGELNRQARAVNYVWNYLNDTQRHAVRWGKKWPSHFDFLRLCTGSSKLLGVQSSTIDAICKRYTLSRSQQGRRTLRYRGKRCLGWVPFRIQSICMSPAGARFNGHLYRLFKSRELPAGAVIKDGSNFSQDARGNWYLNLMIEVEPLPQREPERGVGIDLGLKQLATLSTGEVIANPRQFDRLADKLGMAKRAHKKRLSTNLNARIQNARRDYLHKLTTRIVRDFDFIALGNVNAAGLARTSMAKSVLDAGWSSLRTMLRYKSIANGSTFAEVSEYLTTQTCSECGCLPPTRPEGIAGLRIRRWDCSECGASQDRDVNAARNILARFRHEPPVVGAVAA